MSAELIRRAHILMASAELSHSWPFEDAMAVVTDLINAVDRDKDGPERGQLAILAAQIIVAYQTKFAPSIDLETGKPGIYITDHEDDPPETSFFTEQEASAFDHDNGSWNSAVKELGDAFEHVRSCVPTITRVVMTFE
jgi:hypothetical protein